MEKVLIVDDEKAICDAVSHVLKSDGYSVTAAFNGAEGLKLMESVPFDIVISDIKMDGISGLDVLKQVKSDFPETPVIMITAFGSIDSAVEAVKMGAADYITKPFLNEDLKLRVRKALEARRLQKENQALKTELSKKYDFSEIVGFSEAMRKAFRLLDRAIPAQSNILITGETGTGKGLVAKTVHYNSPRKEKAFVSINCAAIPETLLESQLFGHKKGSFTGADRDARGLVEEAEGGTLFLDEIGEMPLGLQVKILKLAQDKEFIPVGGTKPVNVDCRIISATNQDLDRQVEEHRFRQDLYYRLNVIEIHMPPLRERGDDALLLARRFIADIAAESGSPVRDISREVERIFLNYPWPGNIRELRNVIERAMVICEGGEITLENLPERFTNHRLDGKLSPHLKEAHEEFEAEYIQKVMDENAGDKELVSKILGIDLATLYRKIKRYDIKS